MSILNPPTENSYIWYDSAGKDLNISPQKVAAIVRKHGMRRRRIYGNLAVNTTDWDRYVAGQKENHAADNQ